MTDETNIRSWMEATSGIRDEYVEEAAAPQQKRGIWPRVLSAVAVLVLVIGMTVAMWPEKQEDDMYIPFFAVRAYAEDGNLETLGEVGEKLTLRSGESEWFPGKQTYTLDVSLGETLHNEHAAQGYDFAVYHKNVLLRAGDSNEWLRIDFYNENGYSGYRIVGWCDNVTSLDITLRGENDLILHQKNMRIEFDGEYTVNVYLSYTYENNLTTEQLIAKLLDSGQRYQVHTIYSSSPSATYSSLVRLCGGFAELEQRDDAASLLLQRWVEERERNEHKTSMLEYCGYTGLLLSRDVYWNRLTEEEKTLIHSYGCTREDQEQGTFSPFPGKQTFSYEVVVDGSYTSSNNLTVDYSGKKIQKKDDHVAVFGIISASAVQKPYHGWNVVGWFAEPTELTLTVTDRDGNLVRQDRLLVTPLENGYQIDIIEQLP